MAIRCPVCGIVIQPEAIPAVKAPFECGRCRSQLRARPDVTSLPILGTSLLLGTLVAVCMHLRGYGFVLMVIGLTAVLNGLGAFIRSCMHGPKLQAIPKRATKPVHLVKGAHVFR